MNYFRGPMCPKCGQNLKLSKLENGRWICKGCNVVYDEEQETKREYTKRDDKTWKN